MEVPSCSGFPVILKKGMKTAGKEISMVKMVLSTKGKITPRELDFQAIKSTRGVYSG